ncbi:MAG TPA: vWA domain-containing protein [Polyangiaceae bacterium]|nr:vWA domain-containing protein [Polyangiaceae bacterium]
MAGCGASGDGGGTTVRSIRPDDSSTGAPVLDPNGSAGAGVTGAPTGGEGTDFGFDVEPTEPGKGCQQATRSFTAKIPTVFILVDRSFSMFDPNPPGSNTNAWSPLRSGVLQVVEKLQGEVSFGFSAFAGAPQMCPFIEKTTVDLNNAATIAAKYNSLERSPYKDTPTVLALRDAAETLWADPREGDKYILFVTDGEPDYCNDGNSLCPPDSVVGRLQKIALGLDDAGLQQAPIRTLVFGLSSPLTTISPEVLQAFANAGAGLPVAPPRQNANQPYDPNALYDQCNVDVGWAADFATTGKVAARGQTIGTYVDPADPLALPGTAKVYRPDPNDQTALIGQISEALAGVKSCSFDLEGDGVKVNVTRPELGELAKVLINGNRVPFDPVNGWHMLSETTVQLEGAACASWRVPGDTAIDFDFPCDLLVPR